MLLLSLLIYEIGGEQIQNYSGIRLLILTVFNKINMLNHNILLHWRVF